MADALSRNQLVCLMAATIYAQDSKDGRNERDRAYAAADQAWNLYFMTREVGRHARDRYDDAEHAG